MKDEYAAVHLYYLKGVPNPRTTIRLVLRLVSDEAEIIPNEPGRVMPLRDALVAYLEFFNVLGWAKSIFNLE